MQIRIAAVLGVLFAVAGCRNVEPAPPPDAPRIDSFTASKTRTAPGEEVILTFATTGATKVELTDDAGNFVQLDGDPSSGTAKVAPSRSAFYVLRATGAGGRDTAFVQIAVNEPLKDVFLIAVPQTINSGQEAQLLWGAAGASTVTLKTGGGSPMTLTGTTGSVTVTPASTEQYTLTASGAPGTPPLTAIAAIEVRPVLASADLAAVDGIEAGKTLTFSWRTLGATRVTISEQTFGLLHSVDDPSDVGAGTFDYVLPAKLPNGIDVSEGLALRFTVSAISGTTNVSQRIDRAVGPNPVIELFQAPTEVSSGSRFTLNWKTLNANTITVTANGLPIFRTVPGEQARVDLGNLSLPAPSTQTDYTFIASNLLGASTQRTFTVRPISLPVISTFTLTGAFNTIGDAVTATWTTTNANRVVVRLEDGPTLATVTGAQVASGNVVVTPANSARITLEAWNAAGDFVKQTRSVNYNGPAAVFVTPTPVFRTAQATIEWMLADAGVLEVVGLPTTTPAPVSNSANFIDLTTLTSAETLFFVDTQEGSTKLPQLPGFRFPFLGKVQDAIWVSVNGFIAFSQPAALPNNTDFRDAGDTAPSLIAPLWDDLLLGQNSKVMYAVTTSPQGEAMLVVQWDQVQLAGDPNSTLTFQAQLFETGQVSFVYKTVTPAVTAATVGIKDTVFPAAQQFTFNSSTTQPVGGLELNFFTGGPADGTVPFKAGTAKNLGFFGRTATGRIAANAEVRSFAVNEVTVNEVMAIPETSVSTTGQWIELRNNTGATVDFEGLRVDTLNSVDAGGFIIPAGSSVDAGAMLVLGQSLDPLETGGAPVNLNAGLALRNIDRVRVLLGTQVLNTFNYDAGVAGTSMQPVGDDLSVASSSSFTCNRTQTFGQFGAIGTPGAPNESCARYAMSSIPGRFTPAPAGTEVLTNVDRDDAAAAVVLPQPFTYFGTATSNVFLSTNGYVSFASTLPSDTYWYSTNATTASTSAPNGLVAPFWDDLVRNPNGKNAIWRETDRTIITWEGFSQFDFQSSTTINVQVHLLDTGVIEFHYGDLSSSSTDPSVANLVTGSSATIWLEQQDGSSAVVSSINRANAVTPNSGIRFTPRP